MNLKAKMIPLAKDAANIIPLARAMLCLDCEQITAAENRHCPACGSRAELLSVAQAMTSRPEIPELSLASKDHEAVAANRARSACRADAVLKLKNLLLYQRMVRVVELHPLDGQSAEQR